MPETVICAMSGGVDSSVAAAILKEQGYNVIGVTMNVWPSDQCSLKGAKTCCSITDIDDARSVCFKLGIPHYVLNMRDVFKERVIDKYINEYSRGRTPNPCIECNRYVKFEALLDKAMALGAAYISTGHYALIEYRPDTGQYLLKRSADRNKDQTYVLYMLQQRHLSRLLLPVGGFSKPEIRKIAQKYGFANSHKADSQDLCFTGAGGHAQFIKENCSRTARPGPIVGPDGQTLGRHNGIHNFTVGQRKGLGVYGKEPLYVTAIDPENATVYVGPKSSLFSDMMEVTDLSFVSRAPEKPFKANVKIRYKAPEAECNVTIDGDTARVLFKTPQRAITPGQAAVFYDGDYVIGGGTIAGTVGK